MTQKKSHETKEAKLYVNGMHCASCEILIEKKLLSFDHIKSVDASIKDGTVNITYDTNNGLKLSALQKAIAEFDYTLSKKKKKHKNTPLISSQGDEIHINPDKAKKWAKTILVAALIIATLFIIEKAQIGKYISIDKNTSLPAFFMLGIAAGVSSCAALIGGLLLSMTKKWNEQYIDKSPAQKRKPHILFHSGRILAFTFFGGILGAIGERISLDSPIIFSILILIVSLVMGILALQMLDIRWAEKLRFTAPKSITRKITQNDTDNRFGPFILGAGTFLLPCGFTLLAQSAALASGSWISGALILLLFSLGTFPTLAIISSAGVMFNKKPHLTAAFNRVAGLLIILFVLYNINGQLNVLGLKSISDIIPTKTNKESVEQIAFDGEFQEMHITAAGFDYIPTSETTLKAGAPTRLIVESQDVQGCAAFMAARGLFNGYVELKNGENIVEFVPKKGTYKLTCTMGMVSPVIINVI